MSDNRTVTKKIVTLLPVLVAVAGLHYALSMVHAKDPDGYVDNAPEEGAKAPDFTLKALDGKEEFTLSEAAAERPVVLIFGSYTCNLFRNQMENLEKLYEQHKDTAEFVLVYVEEAHPADGAWPMAVPGERPIKKPLSERARRNIAKKFVKRFEVPYQVVIDKINDEVRKVYNGFPNRLFVVDTDGTLAVRGKDSPSGVAMSLGTVKKWLDQYAQEHPTDAATAD